MPESHVAWRLARIAAHRCAECNGHLGANAGCTLLDDVRAVVRAALAVSPEDRTLARFVDSGYVPDAPDPVDGEK